MAWKAAVTCAWVGLRCAMTARATGLRASMPGVSCFIAWIPAAYQTNVSVQPLSGPSVLHAGVRVVTAMPFPLPKPPPVHVVTAGDTGKCLEGGDRDVG